MNAEAILRALRSGGRVSGAQLAREMGVSRTAVWKMIRRLQAEGWGIESTPGSGYVLTDPLDLLLPEDVEGRLPEGWRVIFLSRTGSTQDEARSLARGGAPEGTVVVAETQTTGRGRLGRRWFSPRGGLYLSVLLRPSLRPREVLRLPLMTGVAVAEAIGRFVAGSPQLKWPNDVLLEGRKVAGILCELDAEADRVHHVILGIGINVNNEIPPQVRETAVSLKEHRGGLSLNKGDLFVALIRDLDQQYRRSRCLGFEPVFQGWRSLSSTLGRPVRIQSGDEEIVGEALDIDSDGALIVRRVDGETVRVIAGDVTPVG
jgi:BirA family biotin operon repressor/biotin-[acetyl-CoA-carboxylase] ligase